jgi:hypothetical protein
MVGQVSFHAACRFFSHAVWDIDQLGLAVAELIVARLVDPDQPITVVVDDTLFRRWGRRVHHAFWTHDGAAQGKHKIGRGNRWVIAGIAVRLPFGTAPVCLPVVFRLWAGKGTASPVELAAQLLALLVGEFADRTVHGVGDAAYHGRALLVAGTRWTTRLPTNAALYAPAPPRTGKRGRPALKGAKLGTPEQIAATTAWQPVTVTRYGFTETVQVAEVDCVWYGSFADTPGRLVLVRDATSKKVYDLALFTTDVTSPTTRRGRTLRHPLVHRARQRRRQAAHGRRASPQTDCRRPCNAPRRSGCWSNLWSSSGTRWPATTPTTSPYGGRPSRGTT